MFKSLKTMLDKTEAKDVSFSTLNTIRDKFGNFQLTKILEGKFPTLSVKKHPSGFSYNISQKIEKTKTKIDYIVDSHGRILSKKVKLGKGHPASPFIKGVETLYSGDIVNGAYVRVPSNVSIQYKTPLYRGYKGFEIKYSKTPTGWAKTTTPFNF